MPTYPVFTSYAQADLKGDANLKKFVDKFCEDLRSVRALPDTKGLVFFDKDEVSGGDDWMKKILHVVSTAEVLVCLMSPTYLGREWCGRELEVFVRRNDGMKEAEKARFIIPIWWQLPLAPRALPLRLGRFNYRDPKYPLDYETLGLKGLVINSKWAQFRKMAYRLAELVGETLEGPYQLPAGQIFATSDEIANAFDEQQPNDVRMLALATGGDAWKPSPTETTVAEAAAQAARRLQVFVRRVETGPGLAVGLKKAQAEEQVVLVVVDAALPVNAALQTVDGLDLPNLALLLVDVGTPAMGGEAWLGQMPGGAFAHAKEAGLMRVAATGAMAAEMESLIDEARRRLRAGQPTARAEDPQLAAQARESGITVETQPQLTGPSGETPS
jgi:TIR domain-containing protein